MKKTIVALGSTLMLLLGTQANAQSMRFGVKGGGGILFPSVNEIKAGDAVTHKGSSKKSLGGGAFFDYMVMEDTLSVGIEGLYGQRAFHLAKATDAKKQDDSSDKKDQSVGLFMHSVDIAFPVKYFPMGRELGLSIALGPQMSLPFGAQTKKSEEQGYKDAEKEIVNAFDFGLTTGLAWEIMESGFEFSGRFNYGFLGMLKNENKAKEYRKDVLGKADVNPKAYGLTFAWSYDFGRLLD